MLSLSRLLDVGEERHILPGRWSSMARNGRRYRIKGVLGTLVPEEVWVLTKARQLVGVDAQIGTDRELNRSPPRRERRRRLARRVGGAEKPSSRMIENGHFQLLP
jgi:hypothetical protein